MLVDWLPWNHTSGGNHNFGLVLYNGGTLYIDDGKPVPGLIEKTVRNLREIAPTIYFNVPRGYEELLPLPARGRARCARRSSAALGCCTTPAPVLPQPVWEAYEELARADLRRAHPVDHRLRRDRDGARRDVHQPRRRARRHASACRSPACEMKLVPVADKLEARFRGPNITPGYWRQPELTRAAFDEEGYYRIGDALRFVDPADPRAGLRVRRPHRGGLQALHRHLGQRRPAARADHRAPARRWCRTSVIAGHDRDELGVLVFPNAAACRDLRAGCDPLAHLQARLRRGSRAQSTRQLDRGSRAR